jgi:hypothetical protein
MRKATTIVAAVLWLATLILGMLCIADQRPLPLFFALCGTMVVGVVTGAHAAGAGIRVTGASLLVAAAALVAAWLWLPTSFPSRLWLFLFFLPFLVVAGSFRRRPKAVGALQRTTAGEAPRW